MSIDPDIAAALRELPALVGDGATVTQAREAYRQRALDPRMDQVRPPVGDVGDDEVAGEAGPVPIRVYRPTGQRRQLPTLVYFHGGGWAIGDLESHDILCRMLTQRTPAVVIAVDYRLAPEHPFPAGLDDCMSVTLWAAQRLQQMGGSGQLVIGGDSAGGNFAAVIAQQLRDRGEPRLAAQLLLYPAVDSSTDYPSAELQDHGYLLDRAAMEMFDAAYLTSEELKRDPRVSPMLAGELSGLAPAVVVTAELDPLRDEGNAYAEKLAAAGVTVGHREFPGMVHGFCNLAPLAPAAARATDAAVDMLTEVL